MDRSTGLICDQTIVLTGTDSAPDYPLPLRRVSYRDSETGPKLDFLTNDFSLPARTIAELYPLRWQVEETLRYIKQSYRLEDIRLLTYERLRTMAAPVMAVAYFACQYLGEKTKLNVLLGHVLAASRRIYGTPELHSYAIADGVQELCYGRPPPSKPVGPPIYRARAGTLPAGALKKWGKRCPMQHLTDRDGSVIVLAL